VLRGGAAHCVFAMDTRAQTSMPLGLFAKLTKQ
jgi:hypothetical protein